MEEEHGHDREKLAVFVRECGPAAIRKACRLTHNLEEAKDLVQEALRRLIQHWERYGPPRSVAGVFVVILRNAFIDRLRNQKIRKVVSMDAGSDGDGESSFHDVIACREPDILDQLIRQETVRKIRDCIGELKLPHQEVLMLADMEEQSYADIASALDISTGTVRSRLFRARESFRKHANGLAQMAQ